MSEPLTPEAERDLWRAEWEQISATAEQLAAKLAESQAFANVETLRAEAWERHARRLSLVQLDAIERMLKLLDGYTGADHEAQAWVVEQKRDRQTRTW